MSVVNIEDLRVLARRRLPKMLFDFLDGGALDQVTLRANRADFDRIRFRPRVLVDVSKRSLRTSVFGVEQSMPLILAPLGSTGLMARNGEILAGRAADRCGIPMCLSTASTCTIEEVRAGKEKPFWFQLYVGRERDVALSLMERASQAGSTVLVFTVDAPNGGRREADLRNGLTFPPRMTLANAWQGLTHLRWVYDVMLRGPRMTTGNYERYSTPGNRPLTFQERAARTQDPSKTWADMDWVRSNWKGKLVVKGILTPEDAQLALDHGADGISVSNHGGVMLDGAMSTISALPSIAEAVRGRAPVFLDGGIRRGTDVLKAISLGATACLIGRAFVYGLAAFGEEGVERAIRIIEAEMITTLGLLGRASVAELDRTAVQLLDPSH
jgi:L-lactate dehydrogenase (cytochrome)